MDILTDMIHSHARDKPEQLAMAFVNQQGEVVRTVDYKTLAKVINQLSTYLIEDLLLKPSDKVALLFPTGFDFIITFLACLQVGVVAIPLKHPGNSKKLERLKPILNECEPACIISSTSSLSDEITIPWIQFTEDYQAKEPMVERSVALPELAFLQFTSGSIESPKGVMVSHANLIHNLELMRAQVARQKENHIIASWLPHYHDMGLIGAYLGCLYLGYSGYYMSPTTFATNPNLFLELISEVKATLIQCPNTAFEWMCNRWDNREIDLSSLSNITNGAEPIHESTLERFYQVFQAVGLKREAIKPTYGLAEGTLFVTQATTPSWYTFKHHVGCGLCPAIDIRIVDKDTHKELALGQEGEIWISSPSNALGYFNRPELTEEVFKATLPGSKKHYLRTGDLGFIHDNQLIITSRCKDLIICNGCNIYPQDIEYTVEQFPGMQSHGCVAFGIENNAETKIVVVAEVIHQEKLPDIYALFKSIIQKNHISLFELVLCPRFTLPKTTSGKLKRMASRGLYLEKQLPVLYKVNEQQGLDALLGDLLEDKTKTFHELGLDSLTIAHFYYQLSKKMTSHLISMTHLYHMTLLDYQILMSSETPAVFQRNQAHWLTSYHESTRKNNKNIVSDAQLLIPTSTIRPKEETINRVLLTGSTGFLGIHLLNNLLNQTSYDIYLLIRASDEEEGFKRILSELIAAHLISEADIETIKKRLIILCGDLALPKLGLSQIAWDGLSEIIDCIYHNGALTHYLATYDDLKAANVDGTKAIIQLALSHKIKSIHYISTTFIFGWTTRTQLIENKRNRSCRYLDFGYAQSKWVAEQLIWQASDLGVPIQIYRPAMITASSKGHYVETDIVARFLTYLINHQVSIDIPNQISVLPVNQVASDIIHISLLKNPEYVAYHLTAAYTNLPEICAYLSKQYGYKFTPHSITSFNSHLQTNATEKDIVFPLVPFFNEHYLQIKKMVKKRYGRTNYINAMAKVNPEAKEYSIESTLDFMVQFLRHKKLISG